MNWVILHWQIKSRIMIKSTYSKIESINESIRVVKEKKLLHNLTEDEACNGREISMSNKRLINFGSCSYLGLETDERLKDAAIDAVQRYGTQFSCSRTYLSLKLYRELEDLLSAIFPARPVLYSTTSLGHKAVIPIVVEDTDACIYDQYAHISMQEEIIKLQARGVKVAICRHNRMDEVEHKIKQLESKYRKIWYFTDGVFSMYGDVAPFELLTQLQKKHSCLHLYIDDAHGMSWTGTHGAGYCLSHITFNNKIILSTSLAKGFASAGGVFLFGDAALYDKVQLWGGPLTYSGPQQPAVLGASIASAKVHLSAELLSLQQWLASKIAYCNDLLKSKNIPMIAATNTPIFFIGIGTNKVACNLVSRLINEGFYTNISVFPAVSENCSGIRFTITNHITFQDIRNLVNAIETHLPLALSEEHRSALDISKAFKLNITLFENIPSRNNGLKLQSVNSINNVAPQVWKLLEQKNNRLTRVNLQIFEKTFSGNPEKQNNWTFHYFTIKDHNEEVVIATFFTELFLKDDILLPSDVSDKIEWIRRKSPDFLCSRSLLMGSLLSEGTHIYINSSHPEWLEALELLMDQINSLKERNHIQLVLLRDFHTDEKNLHEYFMGHGYIPFKMPETYSLNIKPYPNEEAFVKSLVHRRRRHLKKDVLRLQHYFSYECVSQVPEKMISVLYNLYQQVSRRNLSINIFPLPEKLLQYINHSEHWEFILLRLKGNKEPVAFVAAYKSETYKSYHPLIIGLNYQHTEYKIYKQMLYRAITRGIELQYHKIYLGISADLEKRKMGSDAERNMIYLQTDDNINQSIIENIWNNPGNKLMYSEST